MDTKMDGGKAVALSATGNTNRISTRSVRKKKTALLTPKKFIEFIQGKHSSKNFEAGVAELFKEYYLESPTFLNYFKASNKEKNVKTNIWLYDSTRVNVPDVEYIHASYVEGIQRPNQYILAQAPFNEKLQKDFFKMLSHVKAEALIIADSSEDASSYLGKANVDKAGAKLSEEKTGDEIISYVINGAGVKNLKVFKLQKFEDKPPAESEYVDIHEKVRKAIGWGQKGPVVIVCKDGATKCGTFVLLDMETERFKQKGKVRVIESIKTIRNMRSNTFDTMESFEHAVAVLVEMSKRKKK